MIRQKNNLFILGMVLSEHFKDRMKKLAGVVDSTLISEADKRAVIMKSIKLPKEIADWAHNLSEKYSIWIADSFKKDFIDFINRDFEEKNLDIQKKDELSNKILNILSVPSLKSFKPQSEYEMKVRDVILNRAENHTGTYQYILDWLRGRQTLAPETDQINLKTLTFDEAQQRSKIWHDELKKIQGGRIEDEDGEVVLTFPDGFYWIRLGRAKCEKEANAMGHCGSGRGILYSLRRDRYPYITADINEDTGQVMQMKGRANTKPKSEFHKYIIPFILGDKPNIKYFHSTYQANTDFNIADLTPEQIEDVVTKKSSLMFLAAGGITAVKKMSTRFIQQLLLTDPSSIGSFITACSNGTLVLSDVLKTPEMVDWALHNAKGLFSADNYGSVSLTTEQIQYILSDKDFSGVFDIDKLVLDENTINYIIKNNPGLFKVSKKAIYQLNEEQLNYLVKNFSYVFEGLMYSASNSRENTKIISNFLGRERLTLLFNSQPKFFALDDLACFTNIFPTFLTGELLHSYVIKHTPESDPLQFYSLRRLTEFVRYMDSNTQFYILKYYPKLFLSSNMIFQQLSEAAGKYIFDNFFEWLRRRTSYNYRGFKFNIYDWNLSESQKEKLIKSEVEGETSLLEYYDAEELEKFNFNEKQINELLDEDSSLRNNLNLDMIKGFKLTPESSEPLIAQILKDSDEQKKTYEEVIELFGEDFMAKIYRDNSDDFDSLQLAIKYKDIESLKKHNNAYYTYTENVIQFRFDDWSDEDLIELYEKSDTAKTVLNNDLDFYGFDYSFSDTDIDDLTPLNIARIKYLLKKAYPKKFSKLFSTMSNGDLNTLLHDPEEIKGYDSEKDEYNEDIIEHIKDSLIIATEDAQRNADEDEYWNKTTEPMTSRFGKPIWFKQKVSKFDKETGKNKEEQKELLQFEISYSDFYEYIVAAQDSISDTDWEYSLNSNPISVMQTGMKESDELLEININESYGVYGDRESSVVDEYFAERLYENKEISNMLDKARVVVKRKPK